MKTTDGTTLGELGERSGLRIGTAVDLSAFGHDEAYRRWLSTEFTSYTAENAMKWEVVEPERGRYDWSAADELVAFGTAQGKAVRGHTLVWHNQNPAWLTEGVASGAIDAAELRDILKAHILAEVGRYRGRVYQWDVVNEPLDDDGKPRESLWLKALGPEYIADAFRWAHEADPDAKLYLNDYNVEGVNPKSDGYFDLIPRLRADGVPVHGFGMQGHLGVEFAIPDDIEENLRRFASIGVETALTEVDVRMELPAAPVKVAAQAQGYHRLVQACLLAPGCTNFTVWGFTDRYSWIPGFFTGQGAASLLDEELRPKPAYHAVRDDLRLAARR